MAQWTKTPSEAKQIVIHDMVYFSCLTVDVSVAKIECTSNYDDCE